MNHTYRTWAEINLDALSNNIRNIKKYIGAEKKLLAVVKADAYGHGYLNVAKTMLENGADYLSVAFIDEGEQLRKHGIKCPILILGYTSEADLERVVNADIIPTIYHLSAAKKLSEIAKKAGKTVKIHIKVDSGMNRIGFLCNSESADIIEKINNLDNIEIEGIFTHFSCADEESEYTKIQFEKFMDFTSELEKRGIKIPVKHACNSAGIVRFPEYHLDMVRAGIICYGMSPGGKADITKLELQPVMSIKTTLTKVQEIEAGEKISYGATFVSEKPMTIATIPIGYADGYLRSLSGKAEVIVGGEYAKLVGRICMDQCIIDVTNVNNIKVEDEVVVVGSLGDKCVSFDELAQKSDTINYELLCLIGKRVPRVYLENGKITDVISYLV